MKIGIDIRAVGRQRTGDEVYTLNLIKSLLKIDSENQYYFYTNTDDEETLLGIKNKIDENGRYKNYQIISVLPASKMLWTFWSLPRYLAKNPIDILHVQYITPWWLPKNVKLITTIHDVSFRAFPRFIGKKDLFFLQTLVPLSLHRADKVIAISDFTKREIEKYYDVDLEKIKTILNGGASEHFFEEISIEDGGEVIKRYNLHRPFIFYVGTLQPRKNVPFLLKSFERLKIENQSNDKIRSLDLVLAGDKNGRNFDVKIDLMLEKIKRRNPDVLVSVKFIGFVPDKDLPFLYKSAEALIVPSLYEGFGLPIIEAMATGLPVVCGDGSCLKEIAGDAALIFKQNDKKDFTKKIFDIIINEELKRELIAKGKYRANFFSWEKCATETLGLYGRLVGKESVKKAR